MLLNDGHGKFTFKPLPRMAQMFPAFGCAIVDVDGDGKSDIYLVGNFYGPQVETGRMDGGLSLLLLGNGDGTFREVWPRESGFVVPGDAKSLVTTDFNNDGWPDFIIGKNNERVEMYRNAGSKTNRMATVKLSGPPGNPTGIGARVTLTLDDGSTRMAEVYAGAGYLSQSTSELFFGLGPKANVTSATVRWPDGTSIQQASLSNPVTARRQYAISPGNDNYHFLSEEKAAPSRERVRMAIFVCRDQHNSYSRSIRRSVALAVYSYLIKRRF